MADAKTDRADARDADEDLSHLPPENRRLLKWLREYMSEPLSDEEKEYWEDVRRFVDEHPFTFRGEQRQ